MTGSEDLKRMTEEAKRKLEEQLRESEGVEDIYADLRDESENETTSERVEEEISILNKPSSKKSNPNIRSEETEEEKKSKEEYDISPYDEALFPGGPSKTQVESWKKQWEGYSVYVTEINEKYFIFRTLNRFEYKQIVALKNIDPLQREEIICETVNLWPEEYKWDQMAVEGAGIPSTYAQIIMEKSGFTDDYLIQVL